jgi:crotonobetainyl-CoA:carnitine CoA-transferase CaiB-like acyl-CoA transferase
MSGRFSDEKLQQFHDDFKGLVVHVDEIDLRLNEYIKNEAERWEKVLEITQANTVAVNELHEALEQQTLATSELVKAWRDWIGTKRVLQGIGKFMVWLGSFSVIGSIIYWLSEGK